MVFFFKLIRRNDFPPLWRSAFKFNVMAVVTYYGHMGAIKHFTSVVRQRFFFFLPHFSTTLRLFGSPTTNDQHDNDQH